MADGAVQGFSELAICGGTSIYTQFFTAGLLETLYITRENSVKLEEGIPLFSGIELEEALQKYTLVQETTLNDRQSVLQEWGRKKE
jgi:dihydrofolate reductase